MITRIPALILAAVVVTGCSNASLPGDQDTQDVPPNVRTDDRAPPAPTHVAERIALQFVNSLRRDKFVNDVADIPADAELSRQDRIAAFHVLEDFVKSQEWRLWFTSVDVLNGREHSVDCYLRGADGGMLVLLLGYHYDVNEWRIGAYEIPDRTFARPQGESYDQYISRSITESRDGAKPFKDGVEGDGRYFIDYRDGG